MFLSHPTYRRERVRGFYKGFLPNAIRYVPASCITLMTVEYMVKYFRDDEQPNLDSGVLLRSIVGPLVREQSKESEPVREQSSEWSELLTQKGQA